MINLRDTSQNGDASQHFWNLISKRFTIVRLAVHDVLSIAYKDTKNKQNKTEERVDKLGLVQTFPFLHRFFVPSLLFLCFTVVGEYDCTKKAVMFQITVFIIWHVEFDVWRKEFVNFLKFSNTSLPTKVCRVKAA